MVDVSSVWTVLGDVSSAKVSWGTVSEKVSVSPHFARVKQNIRSTATTTCPVPTAVLMSGPASMVVSGNPTMLSSWVPCAW